MPPCSRIIHSRASPPMSHLDCQSRPNMWQKWCSTGKMSLTKFFSLSYPYFFFFKMLRKCYVGHTWIWYIDFTLWIYRIIVLSFCKVVSAPNCLCWFIFRYVIWLLWQRSWMPLWSFLLSIMSPFGQIQGTFLCPCKLKLFFFFFFFFLSQEVIMIFQ